jgi:hypothetical protein
MVIFWIWILSGAASTDSPDRLVDRAYVKSLEAECSELRERIGELEPSLAGDSAERDTALADANELIAAFVTTLGDGAPSTGDGAPVVEGWLEDWRTYLASREDYAQRLQKDPGAQLEVRASKLGPPVDQAIDAFAELNEIPACTTPDDLD